MDVSLQQRNFDGAEARGPRARTGRLLLETAVKLMQGGIAPSVSQVAETAGVSRATAYRYFPSQAALVHAVVDEALGPILDWSSPSRDAEARIVDLLDRSLPRMNDFEATFR
ncbi:MAG: helix-turn-helix domain-containing protein, partial [Mesorhizobium sp.]|nr:helix-turn-helix domain-containing protein [Mesorhizobium sp.]